MKEYQPKKSNYRLDHNVYMEVIYVIRSYDTLRKECAEILLATPDHDGTPTGSGIANPPLAYVIKTEERQRRITAVDRALRHIPEEYKAGVMRNIISHQRFPDDAHRNTYSQWKQKLIYHVAKELHLA